MIAASGFHCPALKQYSAAQIKAALAQLQTGGALAPLIVDYRNLRRQCGQN